MASANYDKATKSWRGHVCVEGNRSSRSGFPSKKKAKSWAYEKEKELEKQIACIRTVENDPNYIADDSFTLGMLLTRYANELTPKKKGAKQELKKIAFIKKHFPDLCGVKLLDLTKNHFKNWIEERRTPSKNLRFKRKPASDGTILRDIAIFAHALSTARNEWNLMAHDPLKNVKRPKKPDARRRRVSQEEVELMLKQFGFEEGMHVRFVKHRVALVWLFALETCMRCSEITGLTEKCIDFKKRIARLPTTKNGSSRDVPLSPRALEVLNQLPKPPHEDARYFGICSDSVDANFRKYRDQTSIKDMTFHDSRHEAITRLVDTGRYNVFEVAAVTGHKDINELLTYYNKSAEDIAQDMAKAAVKEPSNIIASLASIKDLNQVEGLTNFIQMIAEQTVAVQKAA